MLRFIENDPDQLADYVRSQEKGLIVFDGRTGNGKTYLASEMAKRVPCASVDADEFLIRKTGKFVGALKLNELRDRIEVGFAKFPLVVLSSVCARQVVARAMRRASAFVWIERTSLTCLSIDRRDFAGDHNADEPDDEARWEIEAYIKAYNARASADLVYLNAPPDE
jgi:hypothetical protein